MKLLHKEKVTAACKCRACVNHNDPRIHSIFKDQVIYFCNEDCKEEFDADPELFLVSDHFKQEIADLEKVNNLKSE